MTNSAAPNSEVIRASWEKMRSPASHNSLVSRAKPRGVTMVPPMNKLMDHWKRDGWAAMRSNAARAGRVTMKFPCVSLGMKPTAAMYSTQPRIKMIPVKRRCVQKVLFSMVFSLLSTNGPTHLFSRSCSRHLSHHLLFGCMRENNVADEHPGKTPEAEKDKVEEQTDRVDRSWNESKSSCKQRRPRLPAAQLLPQQGGDSQDPHSKDD